MPDQTQPQRQDDGLYAEEPKDNLPENTVAAEDVGVLRKKVTVTVPRQRIDAKFNEMFGELSKTAMVPGFRIGHAPRRLIEKRFGKEVGEDVRNALVGESIGKAVEKADLKTLGEPDLDLDKITVPDSGEMTFSFEVEVAPEFTLPQLKGIKVTKPKLELTDQRVDEALEQYRLGQVRYEATDHPAAEGDAVVVHAKISGEGIMDLERRDVALRVAPGQIEGLPLIDLGTELAGKKAGDTATLKVKVPQAHPNKDWQGKELAVTVAISQVRRRILPEINEGFATGLGFESLAQLREMVSRRIEANMKQEVQRAMRDQLCQHLLANTQLELPEGVAARHADSVLRRHYVELLHRGVPREQIDERIAELQAAATEQAKQDLKLSFILGKIAEQEKIEVSPDEVNARVAQMAQQYNRRPERLRQEMAQEGTLGEVEVALREEKAQDKLLEQAEVTEAAPEPPAPAAAEKPKAPPKAKKKKEVQQAKGAKETKGSKEAKVAKEPKVAKEAKSTKEPKGARGKREKKS